MIRHHLLIASAVAAALVFTGAAFFLQDEEESASHGPAPAEQAESEAKRWQPFDCPSQLAKVASSGAHKREAVCGHLLVQESEGSPRKVRLAVFRLIPQDADSLPPVLFLPGGPGDAFSDHLARRLSFLAPLAKDREILIIDQRGTGRSEPLLECRRKLRTKAHLEKCFRLLSADLDPGAFNTVQSARDIKAVLDHHGIKEVSIYGVSYGTRLATTFAALFPNDVRAMVLDSPVPYGRDVLADAAYNAQVAFEAIAEACKEDERCKEHFDMSLEEISSVVDRMNEQKEGSGTDFLHALSKLALEPLVLPLVPLLIEQTKSGDTELLDRLREGFSTYESAYGLHLSIQCAEFFAHTSPAAIKRGEQRALPQFREAFSSGSYQEQCGAWKVAAQPEPSMASDLEVPTLVLSGAYDPVTPPEYGKLMSDALPFSRHVVVDSVAHGAALTSCGALVARSFFESGGLVEEFEPAACVGRQLTFATLAPVPLNVAGIIHQIRYRL